MYPIFVIEGPDGAGKTVLGKEMVRLLNGHYMHLTYRFKNQMLDYHTAAMEIALKRCLTQPVIIDRYCWSINVYDEAFRGHLSDPYAFRLLDRLALTHNVIYVNCLPGNKVEYLAHFDRLKGERPELFDTVDAVYDLYAAQFNEMRDRRDTAHYDMQTTSPDNLQGLVFELLSLALQCKRKIPTWWPDPKAISARQWAGQGNHPLILFVGEQSNPKGRREVWPFYEHRNSSLWLMQALERARVPEHRLAWLNAIPNRGGAISSDLLAKTIDEIQPAYVIGLGAVARAAMKIAGRKDHFGLYHPAYYKRFKQGDNSELLNVLKSIKGN
jgi:thymidylate kinase